MSSTPGGMPTRLRRAFTLHADYSPLKKDFRDIAVAPLASDDHYLSSRVSITITPAKMRAMAPPLIAAKAKSTAIYFRSPRIAPILTANISGRASISRLIQRLSPRREIMIAP